MGELSGCQSGHYRLVLILARDGAEVRAGKLSGHGDVWFGWYFASFCRVCWNGSESLQVPEAFIFASRIWIMACGDSVESFDMADQQSSDAPIWRPQSSAVQWAARAASSQPLNPDMLPAGGLMLTGSFSENIPGHSELFIMCPQCAFVNSSTREA